MRAMLTMVPFLTRAFARLLHLLSLMTGLLEDGLTDIFSQLYSRILASEAR